MSVTPWVVVLAGGVGSRFWPLSTAARPKQLLPLAGPRPMLAETLSRLAPLVPAERTLVLTSDALAPEIGALCSALPAENIVREPRAAGTAAALAWGALQIAARDPRAGDAVMLSVHADWWVGDDADFRATLQRAADVAAAQASLVTVGIVPTRPDPGFGYIEPGELVNGARRVARFVEKPTREMAATLIARGCLWNSGIFAWRAGDFLDEIRAHTPELSSALDAARVTSGAEAMAAFYAQATPISVDHGVLERSSRVLVLPGRFPWDDVGTWTALRRVRQRDGAGNVTAGSGTAVLRDVRDSITYADEGSTIVAYGVSDLVIVARGGLVLVTTPERATELKTLVDALPTALREASAG
ncbi:MAG TPA: sugar phosphate nucleotidyltransferase [Gemmatimonadaceae bacterium]|nr:sugar phosphate nucleotidyltransferase [Gemmatimonadaceae bacterium]